METRLFTGETGALVEEPRFISVEEYLRTSWKPDRELIGGELKEKPMPTKLHGFVQAAISGWFLQHMEEWGVAPESEVRTRVRASDYRLPDVSIVPFSTQWTKTQEDAPLIAIEIVSDDDRHPDLAQRGADFQEMGVGSIWLIDPKRRAASIWGSLGQWEPAEVLDVPNSPIYLDPKWLWAQVDARTARKEAE